MLSVNGISTAKAKEKLVATKFVQPHNNYVINLIKKIPPKWIKNK